MNSSNNMKMLYWLIGALLTALIAGSTATMGWVNGRLVTVEQTAASADERSKVNDARINTLEVWLARVEAKLDRALEARDGKH